MHISTEFPSIFQSISPIYENNFKFESVFQHPNCPSLFHVICSNNNALYFIKQGIIETLDALV